MTHQNRRTLLGKLVRPRRQFGLAATIVSFGFIGLIVTTAVSSYLIHHTVGQLTALYNIDAVAQQNAIDSLMTSLVLVAAIGSLALVVTFVVVLLISHRIYGPMVAIDQQLKKMIAGDFTARVNLRQGDDFGDIAQTLNQLTAKLDAPATAERK